MIALGNKISNLRFLHVNRFFDFSGLQNGQVFPRYTANQKCRIDRQIDKLSISLTNSSYLVFLLLEIHLFFYFTSKETTQIFESSSITQTVKNIAAAKSFPPVYMLLVQLASVNVLISCNIWKTLFFIKVYRFSEISLLTMLLLSLEQIYLKEVCILYIISIITARC